MKFVRQSAKRWHEDVPGSRWFKADVHVHTIDDLPGGGVKMPEGVDGDPSDPDVLRLYARAFLQYGIKAGVQVLGLTPHAAKLGDGPDTSAVWHIVNVWNTEKDSDGIPFRDKVYAVFPGFEPNVNDGGSGVHLLFLFDPEIGRERYLSLFDAVMDGRAPWDDGALQLTSRDTAEVLKTIDELQKESRSTKDPWDYLVLAPHFQNHHGLLREVKRQSLKNYPSDRLAGWELGDEKLPEDFSLAEKPGSFLLPFMEDHRQAFFHASDAYTTKPNGDPSEHELGYRTTWLKLASPRIEAVRQAFIASESRLRIAYERDGSGSLIPIPEPPDPLRGSRPWLRRVEVVGEAAFFGGSTDGKPRRVTVDFSPDLTCLIGGSMTGKSTLLDGLRVHLGAEMPSDERLLDDVEARGRGQFLAGQPEVTLDIRAGTNGTHRKQWPAVFFSQNELQRLAQDPSAVEEILKRLVPDQRESILNRDARLLELDTTLNNQARVLGRLLDQRAEAEQQLAAATNAEQALEAFKQAGLDVMQATQRLRGYLDRVGEDVEEIRQQADTLADSLEDAALDPDTESEIEACVDRMGASITVEELGSLYRKAVEKLKGATSAVQRWTDELYHVRELVQQALVVDRKTVEKKLAELGHGAEKLAEFKALSRRAGMLTSYKAAFEEVRSDLERARKRFERAQAERARLVEEQRNAFERVQEAVERQFESRIRVRRIDFGISDGLRDFLQGLKQKGITQWWNSLERDQHPSPEQIFSKLEANKLTDLGVSATVAERFHEEFTEAKRYELRALRSQDRYLLELRVGEGEYREASRLSGGKRVSLLLSLLLETHDERPLIIDQPEDELDNRFLWETVLPALRRLKGRRQVIVATHNANIVVNGDADLVIQLEADSEHGRVAVSGAIEDPAVRRAIIETVDGGEKAFELRKAKYGF